MSLSPFVLVWVLTAIRLFVFSLLFSTLRSHVGVVGLASMSLLFALLLFPPDIAETTVEVSGYAFLVFSLREAVLGSILALPLAVSLHAFRIAGRTADVSRGVQMGEQLNPGLGERLSSLESLFELLCIYLVLVMGGYQLLFANLQSSLQLVPISLSLSAFSGFSWTVMGEFARIASSALLFGVCLAAPVMVSSLLIDLAAAFLARAVPKINVSFEVLPIKTIVGLLLVSLAVNQSLLPTQFLFDSLEHSQDLFGAFSRVGA